MISISGQASRSRPLRDRQALEIPFCGSFRGFLAQRSYLLRWWCVIQCIYYFAKYDARNVRVGLFSEDYPTLVDRQISKIKFEFPNWLGVISKSHTEGFNFKLADRQLLPGKHRCRSRRCSPRRSGRPPRPLSPRPGRPAPSGR